MIFAGDQKMPVKEVGTFHLPSDVIEKCQGFSFDIGGSVAKIIYTCKKEVKENQSEQCKFTKLHLASAGRSEIDDIVKFIKDNSVLPEAKGGEWPTISVTGIGANQYRQTLEEGLKMRLKVIDEHSCIIKALTYSFKTLPKHMVVVEKSKDVALKAVKDAVTECKTFIEAEEAGNIKSKTISFNEDEMGEKIKKHYETQELDDISYAIKEKVFPCVLGVYGSAHAYVLLNEDGTSWMLDIGNIGGKAFLGQGRFWTGAKSYEEIMELARKGDNHNVDIYLSDFIDANKEGDDIYSKAAKENDDMIIFCFGKATSNDKEHFKREDLAKSLLMSHCLEISRSSVYNCLVTQSDKVFLIGGFVEDPMTRDMITDRIIRKHFFASMNYKKNGEPIDFQFIHGGSHLGAIGGLLISAGI